MKILIIHLSDTHFTSNTEINNGQIEKIVKAQKPFKKELDQIVLIISGDIAYSGKSREYGVAKYFLGCLIEKIKELLEYDKFIHTYVVPGNHDLNYSLNPRTREDIEQDFFTNQNIAFFSQEEKLLEDFFKFSSSKKCFLPNNYIVHNKFLRIDDTTIKINLINSAFFSVLNNDKGLHHIPPRLIERLLLDDKDDEKRIDITISIMHHHYEWFNESVKDRLKNALYKGTSLLFLGHEHKTSTLKSTLNDTHSMGIIYGGMLFDEKNIQPSSFNSVILDTDLNKVDIYRFVQGSEDVYAPEHQTNKLYRKINIKNRLAPSEEFIRRILEDDKNTISNRFSDYYTFPRLVLEDIEDQKKADVSTEICELGDFLQEISIDKKVIVKGCDSSGKTSLLKYLYLQVKENKIPLIFFPEDIKDVSISKVIDEAFISQYGKDKFDYAKFQQIDSSEKIAFIDDANLIKENKLKKLILELNNHFDYIIMTAKDEIDFNILERAKEELGSQSKFVTYQIANFYSDKRRELVKKVSSIYCKKFVNQQAYDENQIEEVYKQAYDSIKKQMKLFIVNPDLLIQYTKCFIDKNMNNAGLYTNVFDIVFENNIINSIKKYVPNASISMYLTILEEVAYYMHVNKKYPIQYEDLQIIVDKYNEEYDQVINAKKFFETLEKAKILKDINQRWEIRFCNNNFFAYFIARRINRQYNEDRDPKSLFDILENICFGINDNIVLFLSYITQNTNILISICQQAESYTKDWEEFNIEKNNLSFISRFGKKIEVKAPEEEDNQNLVNMETEAEKEAEKNDKIETVDLYDYNEEEVDTKLNKLIKALKYTEIIAKALPNFSHVLKREQKEKFVKNIYSIPNKIIYKLMSDLEKEFEEVISNLEEDINNNISDVSKKIDKEKIGVFLSNLSILIILSTYHAISHEATDKITIRHLASYREKNNINYMIQNAMMYEMIGDMANFQKLADELEKEKKFLVGLFLRKIIYRCLLYNENVDIESKRRLRQRFFNSDASKRLLVHEIKVKNKAK